MTPEQRLRSRARAAVLHAKRQGRLVPPERCESCNRAMKLQAHHDDYERPLEVRWLCRDCHWSVHRSHTDTVESWKRRGIPPWTLKKLIALAEQRGLKVPEDIYDAAQRRTKRAVSGYERSAA